MHQDHEEQALCLVQAAAGGGAQRDQFWGIVQYPLVIAGNAVNNQHESVRSTQPRQVAQLAPDVLRFG